MALPANPAARATLAGCAVIGFCFLMAGLSRGLGEAYAVFLLLLGAEFGAERAELTSVYTVYMVAVGLGSPLAGLLVDRFGPRCVYGLGLACLALGIGLASQIAALWQLYLCIGLLGGFGAALVGIIPAQALLGRWFTAYLTTAMSIAYGGYGFGTLVLAPLSEQLIAGLGWRGAYLSLGIGLAVLLPLVVLLLPWRRMRDGVVDPRAGSAAADGDGGPTPRDALASRAFWTLSAIFALTSLAVYGVSLQSVVYLVDHGFSRFEAASAFGFVGMLSVAGMAVTGIAADRFGHSLAATISYGLTLIGVAALFLIQFQPAFVLVVVFVVFFGCSMGARGPIITALATRLFAGRGAGAIFGMISLGQGLGAGLGAWIAGLLYDITGGYDAGFVVSAGAILLAICLFWVVPEIRTGKRAAA